jgi:hypothetical protein
MAAREELKNNQSRQYLVGKLNGAGFAQIKGEGNAREIVEHCQLANGVSSIELFSFGR